jgi:hypothetical protein
MVGKSLQYGICTLDSLFVLFRFVEFDDMFEEIGLLLGQWAIRLPPADLIRWLATYYQSEQ